MKPKRQKKYTSREQVIKDIDKALRKFDRLLSRARAQEELMWLLKDAANVEYKKHADTLEALLEKAERLKKTRLEKLKRVLAAIDTAPLGIAGAEARQVTLEKI